MPLDLSLIQSLSERNSSLEEFDTALVKMAAELRAGMATPSPQLGMQMTNALGAIRQIPREVATASRVDCLLAIAQYFYVAGQAFGGVEPSAEAVIVARQLQDDALKVRALNTCGILQADTGNLPGAIESYAEALDILNDSPNTFLEGSVWNNLSAALIYAAQFSEAISGLERVIALADKEQKLAGVKSQALGNIALACLHLEDYGKGLRSAKASIEASGEAKTPTEQLYRVLNETYYTRLLLEVDSLERAKERCEIAKKYAAESKSERAALVASLSEGLYEVHAGMVDVGLSRLNKTLERARVMKVLLRDALVAMVRAHEVAGKHDLALVYLRELMLHTKKMQQDSALFHHRLHIERLERDQERMAPPPADSVLQRHEDSLRGKLAEQVAQQELLKARIEMLERLAVTAELRDDSTGEHSYRVGALAGLLAHEFGCDEQTCFMIDIAARLHDIGKIGIPDGILLKPDRLTEAERSIMQTHTTVGAELLAQSNIPHMQMAEEIARFHHEWWDGSGYPFGIGGTAIPMAARITALADVYDALTHRRPYKDAWPVSKALAEIASLKGLQFDPELTDLLLALIPRLQREQGDLDEYLGRSAQQSPFIQAREKISATLRRANSPNFGRRFDTQR